MIPTNKLRFVERDEIVVQHPAPPIFTRTVRILQQWWESSAHDVHWVNGAPGEWRDVPVEKEHG
jgi:hypothetical protein